MTTRTENIGSCGCCSPCDHIVCISVIDEDSENYSRQYDWDQFRTAWPFRQFFLLKPSPTYCCLTVPSGWNGVGPIEVTRDNGGTNITDWYAVCNLNSLPVGAKVALVIDNSGSMTTNTVISSYGFFLSRLANRVVNGVSDPITTENGRLIELDDDNERWIYPFINIPGCPT